MNKPKKKTHFIINLILSLGFVFFSCISIVSFYTLDKEAECPKECTTEVVGTCVTYTNPVEATKKDFMAYLPVYEFEYNSAHYRIAADKIVVIGNPEIGDQRVLLVDAAFSKVFDPQRQSANAIAFVFISATITSLALIMLIALIGCN